MKSFINFLPPWVETNIQPAFYDKESGTCLQQTARMYAKVNQLIRKFNELSEEVQNYIQQFIDLKDYVDNYFDNLDVQEEINKKLDEMAEDGEIERLLSVYVQPQIDTLNNNVRAFENSVNSQLNNFQEELSRFSIAPVAVSSLGDMTDHNTIYVYTETGKWYYWSDDDSAFVIGGDYQPAVADNLDGDNIAYRTLAPSRTSFYSGYNIRTDYLGTDILTYDNSGVSIDPSTHKYQTGVVANYHTVLCPIPFNSYICVRKSASTNRTRIGVCADKPVNGTTLTILANDADIEEYTFYNGAINSWLAVCYTTSGESCNIDVIVDNRNDIKDVIRLNNESSVEYVESTNIFDPTLLEYNVGTRGGTNKYRYSETSGYITYKFLMTPDTTYTINTTGYDKFRVCTFRSQPQATPFTHTVTNQEFLSTYPSRVIIDDDAENTVTFSSGGDMYCTVLLSTSVDTEGTIEIVPADSKRYRIARQLVSDYVIEKKDGGYEFMDEADSTNRLWSMWSNRLRTGMTYTTAYVPAYFNSQIFVDGTIIAHNTGSQNNNRWGLHLFEGYSSDNYGRVTLLTDKFNEEGKKTGAFYYINGGNEYATSYANMKIGSDVPFHSFNFERDDLTAYGAIDCRMPVTLARINPATDIDDTYSTVADADANHHPDSDYEANIKCLKYIYLHNAEDGCIWYDTNRDKVVVKINGAWHDIDTTEVPIGTYDF